jgi:lipopolysaccharide/colanic/teichoic acid biosynthesis glycosyltransferase
MSSSIIDQAVFVRRKSFSLAAKRAIDILGASLGLILTSPTFLLVALLIKLQDGGPVFHRRRMVGRDGHFTLFKFRSMCVDADAVLRRDSELWAEYQRNFKLVHDPRINRLGRFLRKYSLDELPQLFNILRGDMSLVGPRSITYEELLKYGDMKRLLLTVRPGLSGYWQTEGRARVSYEDRVQMDIQYVLNWNLLWDIKIILKTPRAVLKADGAY